MTPNPEHFQQSVMAVARKDVATLRQDLTVQQALDAIRHLGVGEKIVYFYVVDEEDKLAGVVPTRRPTHTTTTRLRPLETGASLGSSRSQNAATTRATERTDRLRR